MYDERANEAKPIRCDTCGAEITTGAMAVFCVRHRDCEFYPYDPESAKFVDELRGEPDRTPEGYDPMNPDHFYHVTNGARR